MEKDSEHEDAVFKPGDTMNASWSTDGQLCPGIGCSVNMNGQYNILFDDGAKERNVDPTHIQLLKKVCFICLEYSSINVFIKFQ